MYPVASDDVEHWKCQDWMYTVASDDVEHWKCQDWMYPVASDDVEHWKCQDWMYTVASDDVEHWKFRPVLTSAIPSHVSARGIFPELCAMPRYETSPIDSQAGHCSVVTPS